MHGSVVYASAWANPTSERADVCPPPERASRRLGRRTRADAARLTLFSTLDQALAYGFDDGPRVGD